VSFDAVAELQSDKLTKDINDLGYKVLGNGDSHAHGHDHDEKGFFSSHFQRFLFCLPFTLVLMLHMIPGLHWHWVMNPWIQLLLCLPVYIVGMSFFGKSAWKSIRNRMPNMNVLIAVGATAAFVYSLYGSLTGQSEQYMFYETAATIITLVFLGNYLEEASIDSTQTALKKLVKSQKIMANMIAFDDQHNEQVFPVENTMLRVGDLILIKTGEQVPIDCKILNGEAEVNEAVITGESVPVPKKQNDVLIGGSILVNGTIKAYVSAVGNDTVLNNIVQMMYWQTVIIISVTVYSTSLYISGIFRPRPS
jgi:Cu+-exporting ATPase